MCSEQITHGWVSFLGDRL